MRSSELHSGRRNVGILTGDRKENSDAPIIVGTTEILRNQLYDSMESGLDIDVDLVILDEAHYLGDPDRGVVWEEVLIYLPASSQNSASIGHHIKCYGSCPIGWKIFGIRRVRSFYGRKASSA